MKNLMIQAIGGLLFLVVLLAAALFIAAGTLFYWQAWVFLAVFSASVLAITLYLMKNDPALLQRRVKAGPGAEKTGNQNIIQSVASIAFLGVFVVSAVDHRLRWSQVPLPVVVGGDVLVALGLLSVFFVFKENSYTSAIIEVGREQKIVMTGPYAIVRHPMYSGAFVMLLGVPLALGSWWGLVLVIPLMLVIIWRLLDEEKFLAMNLAGYSKYRDKVRYRLVPYVW